MTLERTLAKTHLLTDIPDSQISTLNGRCRWRNFEQEDLILNLNCSLYVPIPSSTPISFDSFFS